MNGNNNTFFSRNVPAIVSCISWVRLKFLVCNFQGKKFEAKKAGHAVNLLHSKPVIRYAGRWPEFAVTSPKPEALRPCFGLFPESPLKLVVIYGPRC